MICFGVGITECLSTATALLQSGAEVRMLYLNRYWEDQHVLLEELRALLVQYPQRFRLRHCLSRLSPEEEEELTTTLRKNGGTTTTQERLTRGRLNHTVLKEELGGSWHDGGTVQHYFMIGTSTMMQAVLGMIAQAQLYDMRTLRGHPPFLLIKGPHGSNSNWEPLSPPTPATAVEDEDEKKKTTATATATSKLSKISSTSNFENEKIESPL